MRALRRSAAVAVLAAVAACGQADQPAPAARETAAAPAAPAASTPLATVPAPAPHTGGAAGVPEFGIPLALQGSWGMVPADCTSTRGDAKGLLRISATTLTFYESVGKLGTIKDRSDTSLRADFAFSGEGMTWSREEALSLAGGKLTRTERGGDEPGAGGPFTYTKC